MFDRNPVFSKEVNVQLKNIVATNGFLQVISMSNTFLLFFIDNCNIDDEGAIAIGNGIKKNTTLKCLLLKANFIGDIGAFGLANGLANQGVALSKLDLSSNKITNEGGISLTKGLELNKNLLNLNLRANFMVSINYILRSNVYIGKSSRVGLQSTSNRKRYPIIP